MSTNRYNAATPTFRQADIWIADSLEIIETGATGSYFSSLEWLTGKDAPEKPLFQPNTATTGAEDVFSDEPDDCSKDRSRCILTWPTAIFILASVSFLVAFGVGFASGRAENRSRGQPEPLGISIPTHSSPRGSNEKAVSLDGENLPNETGENNVIDLQPPTYSEQNETGENNVIDQQPPTFSELNETGENNAIHLQPPTFSEPNETGEYNVIDQQPPTFSELNETSEYNVIDQQPPTFSEPNETGEYNVTDQQPPTFSELIETGENNVIDLQPNDSENHGDSFLDITESKPTTEEDTFSNNDPESDKISGSDDFDKPLIDSVTVGVYYYPWYINDDFNGREYMRRELEPPQFPVLGEYSLHDSDIISQHLQWTSGANINLWVTSWSGPYSATDLVTRNGILVNEELGHTKIALFYETNSRIPKESMNIGAVYGDIAYAAKRYFDHPNYLRIDDRPVIFVYVARDLSRNGILDDVVRDMKQAALDNGGHDLYIVGDHAFGKPPTDYYPPFDLIDAATNYDVYGSMDRPRYAGEDGVEKYKIQQASWRGTAIKQGCGFIPSISPGYNDRGVRLGVDHPAMSRKITYDAPVGSLFKAQLSNALEILDEGASNILMINSFNEWHEDTQIEPVVDVGVANTPSYLTQNLEYTAYGELFLDLVREATEFHKEALVREEHGSI